jgi:oxaloacetate decarboxylase alpha subunit
MMSNLVSQLEIQKASDRMDEVLREIPRVRAEVGYPPLVTPMSQIVGTQSVFNVLTGKRWSVISKEMRDYISGYYGKAPGKIDPEIQKIVLGNSQPLAPDVAPGSLVTTSYDELAEEIGDLAKSEEDVLMYAMFPNEARQYLEKKHRTETTNFLMNDAVSITKEEDYVDIAQIRDLVKLVEESGVGEITVEEAGAKVTIRTPGMIPAPVAYAAAPAQAQPASSAAAPAAAQATRPASWKPIKAPMVGTFYSAPSPDADAFVKEGDKVGAGDTLCIVEAMKLMNEITAEEMCVVREVCSENAAPVEFGTAMFYVEPVSE